MSALTELLDSFPDRSRLQLAQHELKILEAIRKWAEGSLPVSEGDRVKLKGVDTSSGFHAYREALADGATAVIETITFSPYSNQWIASVRLDAEWTTSFDGTRCASGPEEVFMTAEWPEFLPDRSTFRGRCDGDHRHIFSISIANMEKVA